MSYDKLVENKIREAMEKGEFDDLPGRGRPVDLETYFAVPEEMRLGYSILKNAGVIPEEMGLLKEVEELKELLAGCANGDERERIQKAIDERMLKFNLLVERRKLRRSK
jgi:hypothetical protein